MNFIFHTLKLRNRERNAKNNSTVKDGSDAVEKSNPKKFVRLAADSTLTFSISVQSATPAATVSVIKLCSSPHTVAENETTFLSHN